MPKEKGILSGQTEESEELDSLATVTETQKEFAATGGNAPNDPLQQYADEGTPIGHTGGQIRGDQSKGHRGGALRQTQNRGRS